MPRAMRVAAWWGCASTIRAFVVSRAALLHDDRSPTKPLRSFAIGHIQNARRVPGNSGLCSVRSGLLPVGLSEPDLPYAVQQVQRGQLLRLRAGRKPRDRGRHRAGRPVATLSSVFEGRATRIVGLPSDRGTRAHALPLRTILAAGGVGLGHLSPVAIASC